MHVFTLVLSIPPYLCRQRRPDRIEASLDYGRRRQQQKPIYPTAKTQQWMAAVTFKDLKDGQIGIHNPPA